MKKILFGFLLFFVLGTGIIFGQSFQKYPFAEWQSIEKFNDFVYSEVANHAKQIILIKQDVERDIDAVIQNLLHHQVEQTRAGIEEYLTDAIELLNEAVVSLQKEFSYNPATTNERFVEDLESKQEIIWNPKNSANIE